MAQIVEITKIFGSIARSAQEQATGLRQINVAIGDLDKATQQSAAMVEESTIASHRLAGGSGGAVALGREVPGRKG